MEKPIEIIIDEFRKDIYHILDTCGMPLPIITMIFNEIAMDLNKANEQNLNAIREKYYSELAKEQTDVVQENPESIIEKE